MQIDGRQSMLGAAALYGVAAGNTKTAASPAPSSPTSAPQDSVAISATGQTLANAAADRPGASDPFRAYRDADGHIALQSIMEIEMLPPRLREAGKLVKEANSLTREIADLTKSGNADPDTLQSLQAELQDTRAKLQEELDKLGLSDDMEKRGLTLDQVIASGLDGLKDLAETTPQTTMIDSATPSEKGEKPSLLQKALAAFGRQLS
jgi:hypothetical protein